MIMRMQLGWLALVGVVFGCGTPRSGSSVGADPGCSDCEPPAPTPPPGDALEQAVPLELPLLCPWCVPTPQEGGETSDFNFEVPCGGRRVAAPADVLERYPIAQVRARYEASLDLSVRWTSRGAAARGSQRVVIADESAPFGAETRLVGSVTFGEPEYFEGIDDPARLTGDPLASEGTSCPDYVRLPAMVSFAAADGTLAATVPARVVLVGIYDEAAPLRGVVDASELRGTLDLGLDPSVPQYGWLRLEALGYPTGPRGTLELMIGPERVETLQRESLLVAPDGPFPLRYVVGAFPQDGCGPNAFSVDPEAAEPRLGGRSPRERVDEWRATVASLPALGAQWRSGGSTDVRWQIGDIRHACLRPSSIDPYSAHAALDFATSGKLSSEDDRIDLELITGSLDDDDLRLFSTRWWDPGERIASAAFEQRTGVRGIDAGPNEWLSVQTSAGFRLEEQGVVAEGYIKVDGDHCSARASQPGTDECAFLSHECLYWPADGALPMMCR